MLYKKTLFKNKVNLFSFYINKLEEYIASFKDHLANPVQSNIKFGFIVGCGHSGTTLLNAKLGNHSCVYALPKETGAFFPQRGLYYAFKAVNQWIDDASHQKKTCIIEKTPKHVQCLDRIKKILPESKIIVITRNPLDTCASLYKRSPHLERNIRRWNIDNQAALDFFNTNFENCLLLKYEDLTRQPEVVFQKVCNFLEIPWEHEILKTGKTIYDSCEQSGNMEVRRQQVQAEIKPNIDTWKTILTESQAEYILSKTDKVAKELGY